MLKRDLSSVGWFPFINLVNHTPAKEVAYWSLGHLIHLPLKFLLNWAPWTWTHKFWPEMTAFHAFIKSDQILSWTSQKKEENDFKGSKGKVFVLLFVDFDPFLSFFFGLFILLLWLWWQGFEPILKWIVQYSHFFFSKIAAIQAKKSCMCKGRCFQKIYK